MTRDAAATTLQRPNDEPLPLIGHNRAMSEHNAPEDTRIDRWLCAVRLVKTRPLATQLCEGGHVRVNGNPAKPSTQVRQMTASNDRSGNGTFSPSATLASAFVMPRASIDAFRTSTIPGAISIPTTVPFLPTACAAGKSVAPVPAPTSSTRSAGLLDSADHHADRTHVSTAGDAPHHDLAADGQGDCEEHEHDVQELPGDELLHHRPSASAVSPTYFRLPAVMPSVICRLKTI